MLHTTPTASSPSFTCAFYAGKRHVKGEALHVSYNGIALQLDDETAFQGGETGECYIDGKLDHTTSSCGFTCEVVSAGGKHVTLRFNPLNANQITFIRSLTQPKF